MLVIPSLILKLETDVPGKQVVFERLRGFVSGAPKIERLYNNHGMVHMFQNRIQVLIKSWYRCCRRYASIPEKIDMGEL